MTIIFRNPVLSIVLLVSIQLVAMPRIAHAVKIMDICRIKGQEENRLQGLGLIIGLNGTGDAGDFAPTAMALASALESLGSPLGSQNGNDLRKAKNVAVVMVTVTVPKEGAREGDKLDCVVSSIGGAKSLEGGFLLTTPLRGPLRNSTQVYGFASGLVYLADPKIPTVARLTKGCKLEEDFINDTFYLNGKITLVLKESHASFVMAQHVADAVNNFVAYGGADNSQGFRSGGSVIQKNNSIGNMARAIDSINIEVDIPAAYMEHKVEFVSIIQEQTVDSVKTEARVNINTSTNSIVIDGNVEIGPVAISHGNVVIEVGNNVPTAKFIPIDPSGQGGAKLRSLIQALEAVRVPPEDMIEIIRMLEKNGKLHAVLIEN